MQCHRADSRRRGPARIVILASALVAGLSGADGISGEIRQPGVVAIQRTNAGFELRRNGVPMRIKGAGGRSRLNELAAIGGNSIRTWHAGRIGAVLDRAQQLGLSVTVGIWLGHERHGFDYSDADQVARQHDKALAAVRQHKNHPAVLMWGLGNEMEGNGGNPRIWQAVDKLAAAVKAIDPHHPTMTVVAGTGDDKVRRFVEQCPNIDVLGVNAYGDLRSIPGQLAKQGLDRPYVLTEFGPFGWWQVGKTSWGAELEPTSTAKATTYLDSYQAAVIDQPGRCLGAYAFLWGQKQEHTHTWFGMFLPTGERTAAVDVMARMWTGQWPANRCPVITRFTVEPADGAAERGGSAEHVYPPQAGLRCYLEASDPDGDQFARRWELRPESVDKKSGGDREEAPPVIAEARIKDGDRTFSIQLPSAPGAYRLFVFAVDATNGAATANVPILVKAP